MSAFVMRCRFQGAKTNTYRTPNITTLTSSRKRRIINTWRRRAGKRLRKFISRHRCRRCRQLVGLGLRRVGCSSVQDFNKSKIVARHFGTLHYYLMPTDPFSADRQVRRT